MYQTGQAHLISPFKCPLHRLMQPFALPLVSPLLQNSVQHFRKATIPRYWHGSRLVLTRPYSSFFSFLFQTPYLLSAAFPPFLLALSALDLQPFLYVPWLLLPHSHLWDFLRLSYFFQPCQASSSFPQLCVSFSSPHSFISGYPTEFDPLHPCLLP